MKALSQSEYGVIRSLYQDVYSSDVAESILDEFTDEDLDDLTDEYIEEQVTEFFEECLEEGLDIDIVEQTICESVDTELEVLTEVTNPAKVAAMRMRDKTSAASGEGQKADKDAGASARAKLKVSKEKVGSASPEKKASKLSQIKGVVKKVGSAAKTGLKTAGKAAQGGVGLAARAVGTAQRAGSAVKSAAKKGYERGRQGSGGSSSSSSDSGSSSSSSSDSGSSSSSGTGPSSSSSSGGGESSAAPRKRKDGLLKRGLKKVVRGISKGVSAAAGAVKAGADSLTDRARKEDMNYNKELATIKELYRQVCNHQSELGEENVEELYKGKHGQTEKQYQDSRSDAGKMVSGDSKMSGSRYAQGRRTSSDAGPQPAGGSKKPESQGKMDRGSRIDLQFRKAALKKEELEATGLFTAKEIEAIVESENVDEAITSEKGKAKMKSMIDARTTDSGRAKPGKGQNVKDIKHIGRANVDGYGGTPPNLKVAKNPVKSNFTGLNSGTGNKAKRRADALTKNEEFVDEAMSSYDRNRKRAAQRAADRNAARAAGKTGVVPGVGYVTPRREKETYTDEKGTVRHKSGAKNEEFEQLDEISQKTATNAYTARRRAGVEGNDTEENSDKGDKTREHIKRKFGDKAAKNADRAATAGTFGRGTPSAKERIETNRDYRTTKAGKMHGQDQKSLKSDLKKRLTRKEELESLHQAYLSMSNGGEQLDEISKKTMGSYVKKASKDVEKRSYSQGSTDAEDAEIGYPGQTPKDKKIDKRQKGIGRAVGKLTK